MKYYSWKHTPEETIKRLQDELWTARYTVLNLMPENLRGLLTSYHHCQSRQETYGWKNVIAEKILEHVEIIPYHPDYGRERAYCPLCGEGSQGPYEKGYALPEGLRRHITGHGNTSRCPVVEQILHLAGDYWDREFSEKERLEKEETDKALKCRRAKEMLYLIAPDTEPKLIDEIGLSWNPHRDAEQLQWAESRLQELGVKKTVTGRVISYLYEDGELCIYANPVNQKNIEFCAYKVPLKRRANSQPHRYVLPDRFKKDLKAKFDNYILEAKKALKIAK